MPPNSGSSFDEISGSLRYLSNSCRTFTSLDTAGMSATNKTSPHHSSKYVFSTLIATGDTFPAELICGALVAGSKLSGSLSRLPGMLGSGGYDDCPA